MKKHVLLGLSLMLFCFISGGVYIVTSIQSSTKKLEKVISFHRVEFLRNNLTHHIEAVQADLLLQESHHPSDFQSSATLIEELEAAADICLNCHHSEETRKKLVALEEDVELYMKFLSRTFTIRANNVRLENARMQAFAQGNQLKLTMEKLSIASADKISERISRIHRDINLTNNFLLACLVLGPVAILLIVLFFLKRFTGSIGTLVEAAEHLQSGDLDYRVPYDNMKDEFKTLARSFNSMALSLKNEQKKFRAVHSLYQTLFESAGDAIMITGHEAENLGQIISANQAASDLYGYSIDELLGMNIVQMVPEGKEEKFKNRMKAVLLGEWSHKRVKRRKKDGSLIQLDMSMGMLYVGEKRHLLTFCRDITEKLQAEEELNRANQMALVGQMAVGLAHEIKNPLAGIKVSLDVLAEEMELAPDDKELFLRVINEISRMDKLLKSLLNYARPPQPHFDPVDLNRLLDNSLKNIEVTTSSRKDLSVHFEAHFAENLPQVEVDSAQIQQVFLNILLNAVDSIEHEGEINVYTRMDGDSSIWIEITDTGKGISETGLEKLFNPFYTTKTKGTGLGLSICKRLVEQHGGTIGVDSHEGSGTSFVIILPLTRSDQESLYE